MSYTQRSILRGLELQKQGLGLTHSGFCVWLSDFGAHYEVQQPRALWNWLTPWRSNKQLCGSFRWFRFYVLSRNWNQVAHSLARFGLGNETECSRWVDVASCLSLILLPAILPSTQLNLYFPLKKSFFRYRTFAFTNGLEFFRIILQYLYINMNKVP
jgi:hypothetical protein